MTQENELAVDRGNMGGAEQGLTDTAKKILAVRSKLIAYMDTTFVKSLDRNGFFTCKVPQKQTQINAPFMEPLKTLNQYATDLNNGTGSVNAVNSEEKNYNTNRQNARLKFFDFLMASSTTPENILTAGLYQLPSNGSRAAEMYLLRIRILLLQIIDRNLYLTAHTDEWRHAEIEVFSEELNKQFDGSTELNHFEKAIPSNMKDTIMKRTAAISQHVRFTEEAKSALDQLIKAGQNFAIAGTDQMGQQFIKVAASEGSIFLPEVQETIIPGLKYLDGNEETAQYYKLEADSNEIRIAHNVSDLISIVDAVNASAQAAESTVTSDGQKLYFRGQTDASYNPDPSVARSVQRLSHEHYTYEQMLIRNPDDFKGLYEHLDILAKMQHYDIATRLLDITQSLSVGSFFAVEKESEAIAELLILRPTKMKYYRSDTVALLTSLPALNQSELRTLFNTAVFFTFEMLGKSEFEKGELRKKFNQLSVVVKLAHKASLERSFTPDIDPVSLLEDVSVQPLLDNRRIIRQQGAFVVNALNPYIGGMRELYKQMMNRVELEKGIDQELRRLDARLLDRERVRIGGEKKSKILHVLILPQDKPLIRKELATLGVDTARVYPEIDRQAQFLQSKIDQ